MPNVPVWLVLTLSRSGLLFHIRRYAPVEIKRNSIIVPSIDLNGSS